MQYGLYDETQFWQFRLSDDKPSAWINFPDANNTSARYKYLSSEFKVSIDRQNFSRETYSFLDWLGDLGGLIDALIIVTNYIVAPFAGYRLQAALTSSLFRFIESEPNKIGNA